MKEYLAPVCKTIVFHSYRICNGSQVFGIIGEAGQNSSVEREEEQF